MQRLKIIAKWLGSYAEVYPSFGETVTPQRCEVYAASLDDIETATLDEAMRRAVRQCKRFPTPAEIRERAGAVEVERRVSETRRFRMRLEACQRCDGLGFIPDPADPNTSRLCVCRSDKSRARASKALLIESPAERPEHYRDELDDEIAAAAKRMQIQ